MIVRVSEVVSMKALPILVMLAMILMACTAEEPIQQTQETGPESEALPEEQESLQQDQAKNQTNISTSDDMPEDEIMQEETEQTVPELPEEIELLFEKAQNQVISLKYQYKGPESPLVYYNVRLYGDDVRVELTSDDEVQEKGYDTVYFNKNSEKATGRCERESFLCEIDDVVETTSSEYSFMTPLNWIEEISTAEIEGSENVNKKQAYRIIFEKGGVKHTAWVDKFWGTILLVHAGEDTKALDDLMKYEYKDQSVNTLERYEVVMQ